MRPGENSVAKVCDGALKEPSSETLGGLSLPYAATMGEGLSRLLFGELNEAVASTKCSCTSRTQMGQPFNNWKEPQSGILAQCFRL